ncbi:hypothetical protein ACFSVM_10960 [Paenibacillus shunpengii]|uniref:Uncharacterized protein n=1 Tax=Paenibacillus shunpengii TaxID=2054424 RepID=A0ABW5SP01_9BACL
MNITTIHKTNSYYWDTIGNDFLRAIVLPHYGAFISMKLGIRYLLMKAC